MNWLKRQWQKFQRHRKRITTPVKDKERAVAKQAAIKKTIPPAAPAGNLKKAQQQALQVDQEASRLGTIIPKGRDTTNIAPPTATPKTSWKPSNPPPAYKGRQKGKSMSP